MRTIFKALNAVQSDLASLGIGKGQTNKFDNYKYRGIDDVLNALAPILAKHGVLIVPSVLEKELRQVATQKGGEMNFATLRVEYTLYDSEGDSITHTAYGEAMDRGDKSINKAMTAAYKYFVFQAFCIPLVGNDADAESHEISAPRFITQQEAVQVLDLIELTGSDLDAFCKFIGAPAVDQMTADQLPKAMRLLKDKQSKMAAQ